MLRAKRIYRDRIDATISSIKKKIDEYQENLPLIFSRFKGERETFHEALGKIILVVGTQSSGKTNLMTKLLDTVPNLASINRKEIIYHKCYPEIDKLFFQDLLLEVSTVLKDSINGYQFYELQFGGSCSATDKRYLEELQQEFREIVDSATFYKVVNNIIFVAYYDSMKPFLFKGQHVVLDDWILTSEEIYNQFKFCCGEYPEVSRILLFADFETSIQNCIARNSKFAIKLANYPLSKSVPEIIDELELVSGGSSDSYRLPKSIMKGYKSFYTFQSSVTEEDTVLATYSKESMKATLSQMAREQIKLLGLLAYRNCPITEDYIDLSSELSVFFEDGIEYVYSICKTKVDHIIDSKAVYHFGKAELLKYLSLTLPWLDIRAGLDINAQQPILFPKNAVSHIQLISSYAKSDIYTEIADNISLAIIKESANFKYLKDFISVIVEDLLIGKIVHIPFCRHKSGLVQLVAKFDKLQTIKFSYHHPEHHAIEHDNSALVLIPLFIFQVKKLGLNSDVVDSRRGGEIVELLTSDSLTTIFSKSNFALEWDIWSKCFGKVIIINGVSTSGKTSFGRFISKFGYNVIDFDDLIEKTVFDHWGPKLLSEAKQVLINDCDLSKIAWGYKLSDDYTAEQLAVIEKLKFSLDSYTFSLASCYNKIYKNAQKFIFSGHNVVIDIVMTDETKIGQLVSYFNNYPVKVGILYSSLQQNLNDCFARNIAAASGNISESRKPTSIISQYFDLYKLCKDDSKNTLSHIKACDLILTLSQKQIMSETETFIEMLDPIAMDRKEKEQYLKQSKELLESIIYSATIASSESESLHIVPKLKNDFVLERSGGSYKFLAGEDINLTEILGESL